MTQISHISWGGYDKSFYGIKVEIPFITKFKMAYDAKSLNIHP